MRVDTRLFSAAPQFMQSAAQFFDVRPTEVRRRPGCLAAAATFMQGARRVPDAACYDVQMTSADPTVETNWTAVGIFQNPRRIQVLGLTPGKVYWFRLRALGKAGPGAWTGAASLMAV